MKNNPFTPYPQYEKLVGYLSGTYSRRMNLQNIFDINCLLLGSRNGRILPLFSDERNECRCL
jgi:hypothetical protein